MSVMDPIIERMHKQVAEVMEEAAKQTILDGKSMIRTWTEFDEGTKTLKFCAKIEGEDDEPTDL